MKNAFLAVSLLLCFHSSFSQQQDSTSVAVSVRNKSFAADSASFALYNFAIKSSFFMNAIPTGFNVITIGHKYADGDYIAGQDAEKIQQTYLQTEGKTILGDVALWGAFSFQNIKEDSTRWAHQTRNNLSAQLYFGSPALVSYNRRIYQFRAAANRNMIGNKLPVGLGLDYRIGDHYSTNDPRGQVSDYQFNLSATLGYQFSSRFKAGAGAHYGYGQERTNVAYKNRAYFESTVYPDYVNYIVNGYGAPFPRAGDRRFENNQTRMGFDAFLGFVDDALGDINIKTSLTREDQDYRFRSTSTALNQELNDYQLNSYLIDVVWNKKIGDKQLTAILNYSNIDGSDYNYSYGANNYLYNQNQWSAKLLYHKAGKTAWNYLLEVSKNGEERQDGIYGNVIGYERLNIKPGVGLILQRSAEQSWGVHLSGIYSMAVAERFIVPGVMTDRFTQQVILHDYLYHTSDFFGGTLSGEYSFPGYKKIQTSIRAAVSYQDVLNFRAINSMVTSVPGNNRVWADLSLNFYF